MNFSPFGNPFSASIPGIHQFTANAQDSSNRYHNNSSASANVSNMNHCNQSNVPPILSKFRGDDSLTASTMTQKYNGHASSNSNVSNNHYQTNVPAYTPSSHLHTNSDDKQRLSNSYQQSNASNSQLHQSQPEITQDICSALLNQQTDAKRGWQSLAPSSAVADYLSHLPASTLPLSLHHFLKYSAESIKKESQNQLSNIDLSHTQNLTQGLGLNSLSSSLLSNASILNQPQQHQMQTMQSQSQQQHLSIPQAPTTQQQSHTNGSSSGNNNLIQTTSTNNINQPHNLTNTSNGANGINNGNGLTNNNTSRPTSTSTSTSTTTKKKKKKKPPKEKKPRPKPGEIRLTTALDGSTLYGCPECHMVYPERGLLEEHLVGHNLERRFICDICNAALKRKDHLTRHKQSHNSERPFVCSVCMKAFKRKEQLTLHFVIHSGEKRHICQECGKGFYRKDHLRKHTRSHIARRVKAELSQQNQSPNLLAAQQIQQNPNLSQHQLQHQQNNTSFS